MRYEVTWDQLEAECDGYRAGFVAVFRKHEGQPTDEKDGHGRTVKVTLSSFAEHMGIARTTFRAWVGTYKRAERPTGPARTGQMGRQVAKNPNVSTDDKVGMLEDLMSDKSVLRAYRERRTPDVSERDAKTAEAWADAITAPIIEGATHLQVPMWVDQLKRIAHELAEYEFDADEVRKLRRAATKLTDELEVQEFRLGLNVEVR